MKNGMANGVWKKSLKTLVSSVCAVIMVNFVDPKGVILSLEWFKHVAIACGILVLFNEARYWKNWADSPNGNGAAIIAEDQSALSAAIDKARKG